MAIPQLNIITIVDAVGVLSTGELNGNLHMVDNSRSAFTQGQGTNALSTVCTYGQVLNWHAWAIDVQTFIEISGIRWYRDGTLVARSEAEPCDKSKLYGAPSGPYWAAVIKLPPSVSTGLYHYQLELNLEEKTMFMTSLPSINIQTSLIYP